MSNLLKIYTKFETSLPGLLQTWENDVNVWCKEYQQKVEYSQLVEIVLDLSVFIFDLIEERVVIAYAISTRALQKRDSNRIRGFPNVNASTMKGEKKFKSDKGHFLGHASGGELDINLFPHRTGLNRGWSKEGKIFRAMERYVAKNIGTFFYHRPIYNDDTWVPSYLEYGVLKEKEYWDVNLFTNSGTS